MDNRHQKVSNLPQLHQFVTGHNADGKAVLVKHQDFDWDPVHGRNMGFSVVYTTSEAPPDLNDGRDLVAHHTVMQRGDLGLVNPGGSVLRCVDFAPGYVSHMHRTESLDYGIVIEGYVEMVLDSGERYRLKRGDVAVQRATQHQWINTSKTEWARMMFVLQHCQPLVVGGKEMTEDLGIDPQLPPSRR
ncbi:hypothetical protein BX600DRAFT_442834 [Xylariales sp. PMI_506]|nr:hypothetical protein BX600DRAFT_442834 [Xylariales sp. PMI_506]